VALKITAECTCCDACLLECPNVGFSATMRCADACPVECCVPDEAVIESKEALLEKAKRIHPDQEFSGDVPSHV